MPELEPLFAALSKSKFRSRFHLKGKDLLYLQDKGLPHILEHARDFIAKRLAPAIIQNDGKQTPYRGHPVFVAQHATACCCRGCLQKWHGIQAGRELTPDEQHYLIEVLRYWLDRELGRAGQSEETSPKQMTLPGF